MNTILTSRLCAESYGRSTGPKPAHTEDQDLIKHFMDSDLDDVLAEDASSFVHDDAQEAAGAQDPLVTVRVTMD